MLKLKKIGLFLLGISMIFVASSLPVQGDLSNGLPRDHVEHQWSQNKNRPSAGKINNEKISTVDPIGSGTKVIGDKSKGILHLPQKINYENELGYVIALIQIAVNRTIGLLSLVTLIYLLYNGFLILSSGADSKNAEKGKKGISTAAIAIAGIALSWLIISIILRLIKSFS